MQTKTSPARLSRRRFTAGMSALMLAPRAFAQATGIRLQKLHCFEIRVSDVARSVRFYQDLFGMPVQSDTGGRVCLGVGDGPQFMAVRPLSPGEAPAITQLGYSVENFLPSRLLAALQTVGFAQIDAPPISEPGLTHRMQMWARRRGATEEFYFADARGLIVQLSSPAYCGGTGPNGEDCSRPATPPAGLMRLSDLNHFTVFGSDGAGANRFYQETFGLSVQTYQGPGSPVTGIGDGFQFVMYAGGGPAGSTPANIHHGCFNMLDFNVERILAMLTDYGLAARGDAPAGPMMHYVTLRMPERGGAEGGTPEVYFTDPDGILLQLQDVSYCGGGGYLGNECAVAG